MRSVTVIALSALIVGIWRGIEAASGKPELNLSQVLSCLAIVNGSSASGGSTDGVSCPVEYTQALGPIRFAKESEVDSRQPAVETLARVLKDPSINGLVIRVVGHSDFIGNTDAKRAVSLYRAKNLVAVLRQKGVPDGRLVALGRSDSEPFGQTQDQFRVTDKTGKCTLLGKAVNCDRRVSIEIASPLVARYGLLAVGRERSSLIRAENVPHVRHYSNGLIPGQPYSIDLKKLLPKEKDLGLKWHPDCQGVASDWKEVTTTGILEEVTTTGSLFDKHAGPLWIRARLRENVASQSGSAQTMVLELAATKSTPEHGQETPLPDYWAVRMRMTNMDDKKTPHRLVPVIESLRKRILGNQSPPVCTEEGKCKTDPQQLERQRAARACLGSLLVENTNEFDIPLIAQLEGVIPDNLAMHGDDRLAQAFGVNAWAPSFSLQPGMELCIGEATYISSTKGPITGFNDGKVDCSKLLRVAGGDPLGMGFESWITDMALMFPSFRNTAPGVKREGSICSKLGLGTFGARIERAEQLSCLATARAILLFPRVLPEGRVNQEFLTERHMMATAASADKILPFIQSINTLGTSSNSGLTERCFPNKIPNKDIVCARLGVNINLSSEDLPMESLPRLRVNLVASDSATSPMSIPLGARLAYLMRHRPSVESDAAGKKVSITKQLKLEFGSDTVVEQSTQLLDQWPVTALETSR